MSTATRSSTSRAGSGASTSATAIRTWSPPPTSSSTASPTPISRSSPTSRTPRSPSGLRERAPISGPVKAAFFNSGTEAVENAVKFARAFTGRPAVIALRGRLPRPHAALALAHLEGASVQGGARPVRARGLPRALPERLPGRVGRRRARRARARAHDARRRRDRRRDRARAGAGRRGLHRRAARVRRRRSRGSATRTGSCSSPTRCRPGSAVPAGSSRWSTRASSPT